MFKQKLRRTAYISLDRENLRIKGFGDKGEKRGGIKGGKGGFPKTNWFLRVEFSAARYDFPVNRTTVRTTVVYI